MLYPVTYPVLFKVLNPIIRRVLYPVSVSVSIPSQEHTSSHVPTSGVVLLGLSPRVVPSLVLFFSCLVSFVSLASFLSFFQSNLVVA